MVDRHLLGLVHVLILPIGDGSQIFQVMFKNSMTPCYQTLTKQPLLDSRGTTLGGVSMPTLVILDVDSSLLSWGG